MPRPKEDSGVGARVRARRRELGLVEEDGDSRAAGCIDYLVPVTTEYVSRDLIQFNQWCPKIIPLIFDPPHGCTSVGQALRSQSCRLDFDALALIPHAQHIVNG